MTGAFESWRFAVLCDMDGVRNDFSEPWGRQEQHNDNDNNSQYCSCRSPAIAGLTAAGVPI
jgi:hypothetical protein